MEVLECHITIGNYSFDFVHKVVVNTSWKNQTATASMMLPSNLKLDKDKILNQISTGDKVVIQTGYKGRLNTIFIGYISDISPKVPIEILCEDEMYQLKKMTISKSGRNAKVVPLLKELFPNYEIDALDVELGNYRIDKLNGAQVLKLLKDNFGLHSFFRERKLIVGRMHNAETANEVSFQLDYDIAEDNLVFKRKEDIKLKVEAISNNRDGSKTTVTVGDEDGEQRTLNFYQLSKSELQANAERDLEKLKYDGYRGNFTAFGEPFVRHGDIVELHKEEDSDKTGKYWVEEVNYEFGFGVGIRQNITLGAKA